MTPNDLLLTYLAAESDELTLAKAMVGCRFGLTGEVGSAGFGATTLDGYLALFTHPDFLLVAGLPEGLQAVEATVEQAVEYAQAVRLLGFVLNPGTHQRFITLRDFDPASTSPAPLEIPVLSPEPKVSDMMASMIVEAAAETGVEAIWIAQGPVVVTKPHPDPRFLAGLLARDLRLKVYGSSLWWSPIYTADESTTSRARFTSLSEPLPDALISDLLDAARKHGLAELWAFQAEFEGQPMSIALAYGPHPEDGFADAYSEIHERHDLGPTTVPLLSSDSLSEVLPKIGTQLL